MRDDRRLLIGVGALLALLFLAQPAWRGLARAHEVATYAIAEADFMAKVDDQNARYKVGDEDGMPVVRPPLHHGEPGMGKAGDAADHHHGEHQRRAHQQPQTDGDVGTAAGLGPRP